MSDRVDELFEQFKAARARGGQTDVAALVAEVDGPERAELVTLIDAYLTRAPRAEWDAEAYERSGAPHAVQSVSASLRGQAGLWPSLLPRLRNQARIKRSDLTAELAERLGAERQRDKVAGYYHGMEQGTLPAAGVSDTVLDALGAIVGVGRDRLRRAGQALGPGPEGSSTEAVFARQTTATPAAGSEVADLAAEPPQPDEVDRLFTGG